MKKQKLVGVKVLIVGLIICVNISGISLAENRDTPSTDVDGLYYLREVDPGPARDVGTPLLLLPIPTDL